jgi:cytochrome c553
MHRIFRWIGYGAGGVLGLAVAATAALYIASERMLRRTYDVPSHALVLPSDPASLAEGRRLATLRGCYQGCHGKEGFEGEAFLDDRWVGRLTAPNLTHAVRKYSDSELERIIRHGVRPDGRSVFIMPSESFVALSDADLAQILAFLRSAPVVDGPDASFSAGPLGRVGLLRGDFVPAVRLTAHDAPHLAAPPPAGDSLALGSYLARSICSECHGATLEGDPGLPSPGLAVVAAYSFADFERLLRTGVAVGGRELGLMRAAALDRFGLLTDLEVRALYSYLHSLPQSAPAGER